MNAKSLFSGLVLLVIALIGVVDQASAQQRPLGANESAAAPATGSELSSVIVDLQKGKDDFEKFMRETLEPQLLRIGQSFEQNVARAEDLLAQLQKDPGNAKLAAQYEDCLSQSIGEAVGFLGEFSRMEKPTVAAIEGVTKSIVDAQNAFQTDLVGGEKQVQENQARAEDIRKRLADLAQQYRPNIEQGKSLPPEVEQDIRLADTDLQTAVAMAKVDQMAVAQAKESLAELKAQMDDLARLRSELQIAFRQGDGQQALLVKVASLKKNRLQTQAVRKRLDAVRRVIAERKTNLNHLGDLVKRIVEKGLPDTTAGVKKGNAPIVAQPGLDILRQHLPKAPAEKGKTDVASK